MYAKKKRAFKKKIPFDLLHKSFVNFFIQLPIKKKKLNRFTNRRPDNKLISSAYLSNLNRLNSIFFFHRLFPWFLKQFKSKVKKKGIYMYPYKKKDLLLIRLLGLIFILFCFLRDLVPNKTEVINLFEKMWLMWKHNVYFHTQRILTVFEILKRIASKTSTLSNKM